MEFRYLGRSGLKVSAISYGNWITHGSQVEEDAANACVKRALDLGITTYDTADVYAGTKAEAVLGRALDGVKRESIEVFTKVFWPTGKGVNNRGLSRKHIMHSIDASLSRLKMDYVDLYQAHRFDVETPLEETMLAFSDIVRQGKALYIGVSEWSADEITRGAKLAREMNVPFISNQPQYSMLWRVIEEEVVPACEHEGMSQIVWSPIAQGVQQLKPIAEQAGLTMAQLAIAWVLQIKNVASAIVGATKPEQLDDNVKAAGVVLDAATMKAIDNVLGDIVVTDPRKTESPTTRP